MNNKQFWDEKYQKGHMPWDIGQAAPSFIKYCSLNKNLTGTIAVLGCGRGHDAFYLANYIGNKLNV